MCSHKPVARKLWVTAALLLWVLGLVISYGQTRQKTPAPETAVSKEEREKLLNLGRNLFVARCSSCHAVAGEKPLRTGPPLRDRKLTREEVAGAVNGRLKGAPEQQRRAVALYIMSFMNK